MEWVFVDDVKGLWGWGSLIILCIIRGIKWVPQKFESITVRSSQSKNRTAASWAIINPSSPDFSLTNRISKFELALSSINPSNKSPSWGLQAEEATALIRSQRLSWNLLQLGDSKHCPSCWGSRPMSRGGRRTKSERVMLSSCSISRFEFCNNLRGYLN
jgi:hypothetical protein